MKKEKSTVVVPVAVPQKPSTGSKNPIVAVEQAKKEFELVPNTEGDVIATNPSEKETDNNADMETAAQ